MKKKLLALFLCCALSFGLVTAALITPAAADSELMIYSENVAVDTVSVPKNEKKTLAAGGLSGYYQWQIQVGGDVAELEVGYALVANLLYGGTANIRCRVTGAAEEPVYSNTVTVQITDETPVSAPAQAPKAPTVISEAEPVGEPVIIPPQTVEETPASDAAPAADAAPAPDAAPANDLTANVAPAALADPAPVNDPAPTENGGEEMTDYTQVDHLPTHGRRVVFQGVEGAYSFGAMKEFFDDTITSFHVDTWKEAMEAITKGEADYAVLPIENSTAGIVSDIYDLLVEYPHYIVGEQELPVEHVLMALPGAKVEDIRTVISHPQALAQCRRFLDSNENWKTEERLNTAAAAKEVSESGDLTMAAVGSPYAAEHFGLQILKEGIFDARGNTTRFVIISGQKRFVKDAQKISVCMELPHQSGSLYNALAHFIYNDLNMTKIESRPISQRKWEYRFFVDFTGKLGESAVENALRGIEAEANVLRVLGNY